MTLEEELEQHIIQARPKFGRPRKENDGGEQDDGIPDDPEGADAKLALQYLPRNVELILDHFGMGSLFWPTLQQLAESYAGLETRERARQIIEKYYTKRLPDAPLPQAVAAAEVMKSREIWPESTFLAALRDAGLTGDIDHAPGLIAYFETQELGGGYGVYRPDFALATRATYFTHRDRLITTADTAVRLQKQLEKARSLAGVNGLVRIDHVDPGMSPSDLEGLSYALRAHGQAWTADYAGSLWFMFDDRGNRLVHYAEKIFTLVEACNAGLLAELMANALGSRTSTVREYPDAILIEAWIRSSNHFILRGNEARFKGDEGELNPIEKDTVEIMQGQGALKSQEIVTALTARGYGNAHIQKQVFTSPLVHVDRSGGRGHFRFMLVKDLAPEPVIVEEESEYDRVRQKLMDLESTDIPTETKARSEQRILSRWLFGDHSHACCALCGKDFSISSLVTAHKKKRAFCSETERRDPYIVFPLCKFGCDHLYEHGFVTVRGAHVVAGRPAAGGTEGAIVAELLGRAVEPRWTAGPASYFDNLPDGQALAEDGAITGDEIAAQ